MFYSERGRAEGQGVADRIGYATSEDGIHWNKYNGFPILSYKDEPAITPYATPLFCGSVIVNDSTLFLYYYRDWHESGAISVATGTVTHP